MKGWLRLSFRLNDYTGLETSTCEGPDVYGNRKGSRVVTPVWDCENLVDGIVYPHYSLGASIAMEASPSCVRSRDDIAPDRDHTLVFC